MSKEKSYNFENRAFFCIDNGKEVAKLDEENAVVFNPGMLPAHKSNLNAWMIANGMKFANMPEVDEGNGNSNDKGNGEEENKGKEASNENSNAGQDKGEQDKGEQEEQKKTKKLLVVKDIPFEQLPRFDKRLGMETPNLRAYIAHHQLDQTQVTELVRRLERGI